MIGLYDFISIMLFCLGAFYFYWRLIKKMYKEKLNLASKYALMLYAVHIIILNALLTHVRVEGYFSTLNVSTVMTLIFGLICLSGFSLFVKDVFIKYRLK